MMQSEPKPIDIKIPVGVNSNGQHAVMYSMMDEFSLRRLRTFIDDLIEWKAAGNACTMAAKFYAVIEEKNNE